MANCMAARAERREPQRAQLVSDGNVSVVKRLLANKVLDVKRLYYGKIDGYYETKDIPRDSVQKEDMAMCRALIAGCQVCKHLHQPQGPGVAVRKVPEGPRRRGAAHPGLDKLFDPIYEPWPVITASHFLKHNVEADPWALLTCVAVGG
ncbi:hypothetical protein FN846DRAFT_906773 [Sphaerosporella brunnea]|uniref:Uncharacterized protein n=1 Tax=Sphaerosporella brunnea TaxID=1250544 RepID=A0A5J5EY16_9PEZI|nr:hypothetical protein FN846DRAFT_906773 [Sphaerosporella brunnea]